MKIKVVNQIVNREGKNDINIITIYQGIEKKSLKIFENLEMPKIRNNIEEQKGLTL